MSKLDPSVRLLHLMLRAQHHARKESSDTGYAMMLVSIVTILIFSLLAAYLTITNISKSATNAYTEANSTFYAAESGLNQRSDAVRQKFIDYVTPSGVSPGAVSGSIAGPNNMSFCLDSDLTNDGSGDFACQKVDLNYKHAIGTNVGRQADGTLSASDFANNVNYTAYSFVSDRTIYIDPVRRIPQVQVIPAGQIYAGLNAQEYRYTIYSMATSRQAQDLDARAMTVLEMTFKSRNIPLFQFAAFYNGDLEMNSTSQMDINGRVHTNANLYIQPTPFGTATTRLLGQVTAANSIYNRVDAITINRYGDTQVLLTGNPNNPGDPTNVYKKFPDYDAARFTPLDSTEIAGFQRRVLDGAAGATVLQVPQPGFLRKRDADGNIGEYYGKADLRLEMVPKRAAGNVPFNFTSIKDGGSGGSCTGFDISTGRQGTSLKCTRLNEGQLRSLMQPVMSKVVTTEERDRLCPTVAVNHDSSLLSQRRVLRALQVAIAAQNTPIPLNQLNLPLSDPANASISSIATSLESTLNTAQSPAQLAGAVGGCFLPAPIQVLTGSGGANSNYTWQSSYFDRRENRWIGMLQSNIASLTMWNRDGVYVDRDNDITTNDGATAAQTTAAFNGGNNGSTSDTNNLLFIRATANATAATGSFQKLGLAASDTTEGGLVYHATVSDDLDGDGSPDLTVDTADNLRNYTEGKRRSSYGFAFSGGSNLPGPMTVVTDRGLYVQGDYNNFATNAAKHPAALIGDTITVLSNQCIDGNTAMINCGITTGQNAATPTSVNAAFLSYTDTSVGNSTGTSSLAGPPSYSGGLNNYMRMVENWGGQNFNYSGSFVSLGSPQEFSGAYQAGGGAGYYNVPIRNFNYEVDFNAFDRLPPLTPRVIYLQQETFKRSY
ncbi:hypothetical protein [Chamaesiphon minutus]|uniref:Uncharacterized protein n=1 Tax=Chamaesiphon minutus (strain ATCC 27169 / PCC 6605) TaxID=1173020 RepID=K9UN47_CHAP6|nr:hypothetical protein [Chamaesiphon minutus]AFY95841.1 hypothetical protein Cha6605_4932 [Chamaesiphon minutus PCC 6605]